MTPRQLTRIGKSVQEDLSEAEDVIVAYVFGSTAEGKEHAFSDIDVAILLKEPSIERMMRIHGLLTEQLGERVETLFLNLASPLLKYQVIKIGLRVVSKNENERVSFEAKALSEGLDEGLQITRVRKAIFRRLLS